MTVSLMDSISDKHEKELLEDPDKLHAYLENHIQENNQMLNDDEIFCDKDIEATIKYVQTIEEKFHKKIQELKAKLEAMRRENARTSEQNRKQFDDELQIIGDLFSKKKHHEAWEKFKEYEKHFAKRKTLIREIPKLHMNETDIEQFFSSDNRPNPSVIQPTTVRTPVITSPPIIDYDKQDEIRMSKKEELRKAKVIERVLINKDNEEMVEEKNERETDKSLFGIRSRRGENQQTATINDTATIGTISSITNGTAPSRYQISTRLGPAVPESKNLPFSRRIISAPLSVQHNNIHPSENYEQIRFTPTPPDSVSSPTQHQTPPIQNDQARILILNPVLDYKHDQNKLLLMTSNAQYVVLFNSQFNRLDRWQLGAIERGTHIAQTLDWHDGLIISMGSIGRNNIYMFTEREFFIYSINQRRKLDSRILKHGNDDGSNISNLSSTESQRGIGTVYDKYMYHIYLNRNSHWTLSKTLLEKLVHICDYDLTRIFPDVLRFIHFCVNDKTINFLVQMNDLSYAVVFCSKNDCNTNEYQRAIILLDAQQPLTICSAFIQSLKQYLFFINDPSNDILHIINTKQYLRSYSIGAYAICYVGDKHELMIVRNTSICSVNLNEPKNLIF